MPVRAAIADHYRSRRIHTRAYSVVWRQTQSNDGRAQAGLGLPHKFKYNSNKAYMCQVYLCGLISQYSRRGGDTLHPLVTFAHACIVLRLTTRPHTVKSRVNSQSECRDEREIPYCIFLIEHTAMAIEGWCTRGWVTG